MNVKESCARLEEELSPRLHDWYDDYQRDKAQVIHSSAFRRLQAIAQILGVSGSHRTRMAHSIETSEIGERLLGSLKRRYAEDREVCEWLPSRDLLVGACLAHDLGHPPFGHAGERALQSRMVGHGGFEGNAHTLRIVTQLEKIGRRKGMNLTRRFILALIKYPAPYSAFDKENYLDSPPKCYFDSETRVVEWALCGGHFSQEEVCKLRYARSQDGRPEHRTLDCSIVEYADDIEYRVHDLEDFVAHRVVCLEAVIESLRPIFCKFGPKIEAGKRAVSLQDFKDGLSQGHARCKEFADTLVDMFVNAANVRKDDNYGHPLLKLRIGMEDSIVALLAGLDDITRNVVIQQAEIQQRHERAQAIIRELFDELMTSPESMIPTDIWKSCDEDDSNERRVCDYIAGMTDNSVGDTYRRLLQCTSFV